MDNLEYLERELDLVTYIFMKTSENLSAAEDAYRRNPNENNKNKVNEIKKDYDRLKKQVDNLNDEIIKIRNSSY